MGKGVSRPRPAVKEDEMVSALRRRIVAGEFAGGTRLPTRVEIERHFQASTQTVQRAMARLQRDGFIVTRGKGGTRVAERPPHLFRYGFVTGTGPQDSSRWPSHYFQRFLFEEAMALNQSGEAWIAPYTMVDCHVDGDDFQRLFADVERQCLAGLIFDTPTFLQGTPLGALLDEPHLPAVTFSQGTPHPNLSAVNPEVRAVINMALDYFAAAGKRRVALLANGFEEGDVGRFAAAAATRGLETRSTWMHYIVPPGAGAAAPLCELLMDARERPDALLIADDCLVEPATRGLAAAGVRSEADLAVVTHANFPRLPTAHVPVRRIGFEVPEVVRTCLHILRQRRTGHDVPRVTKLQPHWQDSTAMETRTHGHTDTRTDTDQHGRPAAEVD